MTRPADGDAADARAHDEPCARVAYLTSQYPALSHAFIEREIRGLRRLGVEITPFSVRPPRPGDILAATDREAAEETIVLLGAPPEDWWRALLAVLAHPFGLLMSVIDALRGGPPGLRARVWRVFHLAEAILLVYYLRQRGLRHVHVHLANNGADVGRIAAALGQACFPQDGPWHWSLTMHGPVEFRDVTRYDLAAKVRSAQFVSCISDFCRGQLLALVPAEHWSKLSVVHMGIEPDRYAAAGNMRAARTLTSLRVLFVGRLVEDKGPELLLDAVAHLHATVPSLDLDVVIIGNGPLREHLSTRADVCGIGEHVRLLGGVGQDDLADWYRWADVFCLPSLAEGLPVVLMEAMATELPVITTQIVGIPELVRDGVHGRLVPAGRSDLIASALLEAADRDTRLRWGAACREAVLGGFVSDEAVVGLRDIFAAAMADPESSDVDPPRVVPAAATDQAMPTPPAPRTGVALAAGAARSRWPARSASSSRLRRSG